MTADTTIPIHPSGSGTPWHTLTLICAGCTLIFALLSMLVAARLSSLQTESRMLNRETAASEAEAAQAMQTALKDATVNLETARQALDAEKAASDGLRRRLSGVTKTLDQTQALLVQAERTIATLQSAPSNPTGHSRDAAEAVQPAPAAPADQPGASASPEPLQPPPARQPITTSPGLQSAPQPASKPTPAVQRQEEPSDSSPGAASVMDAGATAPTGKAAVTQTNAATPPPPSSSSSTD